MITPSQITLHLQRYLPSVTDKFSNRISVSSASSLSNIVTVNTASAHGLSVGGAVIISQGVVLNRLPTAVLEPGGIVRFGTEFDHDKTQGQLNLDTKTLTLSGFGSAFDGIHSIDMIPSRRFFDIALPSGETTAPTLDGNQYLHESLYNLYGVKSIASVPSDTSFTFEVSGAPIPDGPISNMAVDASARVFAAKDIGTAEDYYTKSLLNQYAAFVIMTDADVSKDRHTDNDQVAGFTEQDYARLDITTSFSVAVFIPISTQHAGLDGQEDAYGEILRSLLQVLYRHRFNTESRMKYTTVLIGHGQSSIENSAYYVHVYDWQQPETITYESGFVHFADQGNVAFRNIQSTWDVNDDDRAQAIANINLDQE